jgi:hypothetical protein
MDHVEVPRTRALADNPKYNPAAPASESNPKMIEVEVPAKVKRHERVTIMCQGKRCGHVFTATFDEIVRMVACPRCERETPTPNHTWGNP